MKKSLIALAALSTIAGSAFAQSSVSIYGVLDASEYRSNSNGVSATSFNTKSVATSRLGVRGSEDLGSGLKANFNLEEEVSLATGAQGSSSTGAGNGTFNRAANVGLESNQFGALTLGRQAAPIYAAAAASDAFGINSLGFLNSYIFSHSVVAANPITGVGAQTTGLIGAATALSTSTAALATNTIPGLYNAGVGYASPVWNGLQAKLFATPGTAATASAGVNAGAQQQALASYAWNGLNLTAAVGKQNLATSSAEAQTEQLYAANYTYGQFKASIALSQLRYNSTATFHNVDVETAGLTYAYNTKTTFGIEWTEAKDKTAGANKSTTTGLLANYALSPRTSVYGLAGFTQNKGAADLTAVYGGTAPVATVSTGHTADSYVVGIKHTF